MQTNTRGNRGNIRLRLSYMGRDVKKKENSFSKSLQSSDFVTSRQQFIGRSNPELEQLRSSF